MRFARLFPQFLACFLALQGSAWAQLSFGPDFFERHFYYDAADEHSSNRRVNTGFSYEHQSGYFAHSAARFERTGYQRNLTTGYRLNLHGLASSVDYSNWGHAYGTSASSRDQVTMKFGRGSWRGAYRLGEDYNELEAGRWLMLSGVKLDLSLRNRELLSTDQSPTREFKLVGTRGPIKWTTRLLAVDSEWQPRTLLEYNPTRRASFKFRYADQRDVLQREGASVVKVGRFEIGTHYNSVQSASQVTVNRGVAVSRRFTDVDMQLRLDNANASGTRVMLELNLRNIADILERTTEPG